jgi:hypothetical protein
MNFKYNIGLYIEYYLNRDIKYGKITNAKFENSCTQYFIVSNENGTYKSDWYDEDMIIYDRKKKIEKFLSNI